MKLLFHCFLLIIYTGTSNAIALDELRETALELLKKSIPDALISQVQPKDAIVQPDRLFHAFNPRNGQEKNIPEDFTTKNAPVPRKINDDLKNPTSRQIKRRRKKVRYRSRITLAEDYKNINVLRTAVRNDKEHEIEEDLKDIKIARKKALKLRNIQKYANRLNSIEKSYFRAEMLGKPRYLKDAVLNDLKTDFRKNNKVNKAGSSEDELDYDWREDWRNYWEKKKEEARNSSARPDPEEYEILGLKPWGVHCGDAAQHDMPWGTCTNQSECDPEYRIPRGDLFCNTVNSFICCALLHSDYDLVQGLDVSFNDKSLSTDERERVRNAKHNEENKKKQQNKMLQKRRRQRDKMRIKIRKKIQKIIGEIKSILDKHFKNGSVQRKKKTKLLKKFIESLKLQYRKDRNAVKEIHEAEMVKIDGTFLQKLLEIKVVNAEFLKNETFREIVMNGTITKKNARMLLRAYPQLVKFINITRRSGIPQIPEGVESSNEHYDVEYGYLYE